MSTDQRVCFYFHEFINIFIICNYITAIQIDTNILLTTVIMAFPHCLALYFLCIFAVLPSSSAVKFLLISGLSECVTQDVPTGVNQVVFLEQFGANYSQTCLDGISLMETTNSSSPRSQGAFRLHPCVKTAIQQSMSTYVDKGMLETR